MIKKINTNNDDHSNNLNNLNNLNYIEIEREREKEMEIERERNRRSIFTVTPETLKIVCGSENNLDIKFSPPLGSSGVYSGALKIKTGN